MALSVGIFECRNCGAAVAPSESKCGYCKTALSANGSAQSYAENDYDRAIAQYTEAIKRSPRDSLAYHNRGFAYEGKGDYERAMADYSEAIRIDPGNSLAYRRRARSFQNKGDYQHALNDVNEAVRLNPEDDIAISLLVGTKRTLDALGGIKQSIDVQTAIQEQSAQVLEGIRDTLDPDGLGRLTDAIRRNPNDAGNFVERARVYQKRADRHYAKWTGSRREDSYGTWHYDDSELDQRRENISASLEDLKQAIERDPSHVEARLMVASVYADQYSYQAAIEQCEHVLQIDPKNKQATAIRKAVYAKYRSVHPSAVARIFKLGWR